MSNCFSREFSENKKNVVKSPQMDFSGSAHESYLIVSLISLTLLQIYCVIVSRMVFNYYMFPYRFTCLYSTQGSIANYQTSELIYYNIFNYLSTVSDEIA